MNFKKKAFTTITSFALVCSLSVFTACNLSNGALGDATDPTVGLTGTTEPNTNEVNEIETDDTYYDYELVSNENGTYIYECNDGDEVKQAEVTITYVSGTENCYTVSGNTITFGAVTENSVYAVSGEFYGNIIIDVGDDYKFELEMHGLSLTSYTECPIAIESGDKVTLSAKNGTQSYIYDLRDEASEEEYSGCIFADCDLAVQGKGELYVKSVNNNGIHTKDDLSLKNLTLQVECMDNALKGNDEVSIESGNLTLIASKGDGIKTSNSDLSKKGNQKGSVIITGGTLLIYAACDGIDAAYDVIIDESSASVNIQIYTDKYSKYSEEVTAVSDESYYIRFTSSAYKYSIYYFNDENDGIWVNSSSYTTISPNNGGFGGMGGMGSSTYCYYEMEKPSGYSYMKLYIYSSTQSQGQNTDYVACSGNLTLNESYDTLALTSRNGSMSLSWTNKSTVTGGKGGFGGMNEGNADKGDYSTKGIKADNEIVISAGSIYIQSYDDGIHANTDVAIESGATPTGNITISGGTIQIATNDDGIHSDGKLMVSGGSITITKSYEGLEGAFVEVSGGDISIVSSDDGVNGTSTSGAAITISGGNLYVYAGGDGLDSNSTTSYGGILISGGTSVIISTGSMDAAIDNENGYKYTGGYVVAINTSGGMSSESTRCQNFSSVGTSKSISLTAGNYLTVNVNSKIVAAVQIPKSSNATVVYLGSNSATFSFLSTFSESLNGNGVYWNVE